MKNKNLLLNYIFIIGIVLLFVNDHYLKFLYPGIVTGKLSDVCGILVIPFLLTYIFPRLEDHSVWITAILFSFWKSEYSQYFIDAYNRYSYIETSRIIDYSDLLVLILLPIPYSILKNDSILESVAIKRINSKIVLLPSLLILMATAPAKNYYLTFSKRNLRCHNCSITINQKEADIIDALRKNGITFDSISVLNYKGVTDSIHVAKKLFKKELVIGTDTLRNIDVAMEQIKSNKTKIFFNGMDVSKKITEEKLEKKLRKYYSKLLFNAIKQKL